MISHRGPNTLITLAPAQARLRVRPSVYLRRNPAVARDLAARLIVLGAGLILWQWPLLVIGAALLVWPILRFRKVSKVLHSGSPCAAKVISLEPPLVACIAEMSRAINASYPTLFILKAQLSFEQSTVESGDRIAVVGIPVGGLPNKAEGIEAYIVSTVCDEPIGPVLDAVAEWHWDDLEDGLFQISHPYVPGSYPLACKLEPNRNH